MIKAKIVIEKTNEEIPIYIRGRQYKKLFRDLFFEYQIEGLKPKEAMKKAKKVLACFKK